MKFSKEIIERICKLLKKGNTITSTCAAMEIHRDTLYKWMNKKIDVFDTIKEAMAIPDKKVENALYKSATMGHRYKEKEFKAIQVGEKIKLIPIKTVTKIIPPNVTAQIFYLKNRLPEDWKDRHDLGLSGNLNIKVITAVPRPKEKRAPRGKNSPLSFKEKKNLEENLKDKNE